MAVTRKVYAVQPRPEYLKQINAGPGEWAQLYDDAAVQIVLDRMAPAERIVSTSVTRHDDKPMIYIFTESFGLGPIGKGTP